MHLDNKLNFQEHLDKSMTKIDKAIGLLHKLQVLGPSIVTIYEEFKASILIMGILSMIKHTKNHFITN